MHPTFINYFDLFRASYPGIGTDGRTIEPFGNSREALLERSEAARSRTTSTFLAARMALRHDIAQFSSRHPLKSADHRSFRQMYGEEEIGPTVEPNRYVESRTPHLVGTAVPHDATISETRESQHGRHPRREVVLSTRPSPNRGRKVIRQPDQAEDDVQELPVTVQQQKAEAVGRPRM